MAQSQIESLDAAASTMTLSLDIDLYPKDVLYAAAYVFIDRAYVLLDRVAGRHVIRLRGKQPLDETTLRAMAGEFENELLAQALRRMVGKANQKIIEEVTTLAIVGAAGYGHPGGESAAVGASDDGKDFLDDPLGIAKPWEPSRS